MGSQDPVGARTASIADYDPDYFSDDSTDDPVCKVSSQVCCKKDQLKSTGASGSSPNSRRPSGSSSGSSSRSSSGSSNGAPENKDCDYNCNPGGASFCRVKYNAPFGFTGAKEGFCFNTAEKPCFSTPKACRECKEICGGSPAPAPAPTPAPTQRYFRIQVSV